MGRTLVLDDSTIDKYRGFIPYDLAPLLQEEGTVVFGINYEVPIGVAILEDNGGGLLRYIYILEEYRGIGLGTEAVREILFCMHFCMQDQIRVRIVPGRCPQLYSILKTYNPQVQQDEIGYLDFRAGDTKSAKRLQMSTANVVQLNNCLEREIYELKNLFESKQIRYMPSKFEMKDYEQRVSCVYMENHKAVALLLAKRTDQGMFVDYMASLAKDKTAIIKMMAYGISKTCELYGNDCMIHAAIVNENLTTILEIVLEKDIERQETLTVDLSFIDRLLIEEM